MKLDPYKHEERYFNWKIKVGNSIPNLSESNSKLILHYLNDMEKGMNIASASAKGSRSYTRLNSLRDKLCFFARKFQEIYNLQDICLIGFYNH